MLNVTGSPAVPLSQTTAQIDNIKRPGSSSPRLGTGWQKRGKKGFKPMPVLPHFVQLFFVPAIKRGFQTRMLSVSE